MPIKAENKARYPCVLCGKENLTAADINERCGNTNGTTQDEALLRAMEPEQ